MPTVEPYLFFNGRAEEAVNFYVKTVGAKVEMLMRFDQSPEPMPPGMLPPGFEKKVMHASVMIGSCRVMASDGCGDTAAPAGFSLALSVATEAEADRAFAALSEGGKVIMPLTKTFWSPKYGQLKDKFGVQWMVMVPGQQ